MDQKKFLTVARRNWLAKFFQNSAVVLLAGAAGGELFLKISLRWRLTVIAGFLVCLCLGLIFAVDEPKEKEED